MEYPLLRGCIQFVVCMILFIYYFFEFFFLNFRNLRVRNQAFEKSF